MFWRESGKLDEELSQMDECMPWYYRLTGGHGSGAEAVMRAEAHFQRGELDEAERLCHRALFTAELKRQSSICQCVFFLLCRIAVQRGDAALLEEARRRCATARQRTPRICAVIRSTWQKAPSQCCWADRQMFRLGWLRGASTSGS